MTREENELITRLVKEESSRLQQMAYRYTGNSDLAEDLVQETFLTACWKITKISGHENLKGWLYKTLQNLSRREMRKAYHREVELDTDYIEGSSGIELPMDCYLPDGLKDKEREIILMRFDKGMSYGEIAEKEGLTENACRQQLSRAIRKCRDLMDQEKQESLQ